MRLKAEGAFFQLSLLGYQYPDAEGEPYDANWLRVRVDAAGPQGAWSAVDPCLLAEEAERLAEWLEELAEGRAIPALSFMEPALLFRRVTTEHGPGLTVHFGPLVYPPWAEQNPTTRPDLSLTFPVNAVDLKGAARELKAQLKKSPPRREM